jgi:DNA-binding transcriptional LysR family regulator
MASDTAPAWRLRPQAKRQRSSSELTLSLAPRLVSNDISTLKRAAVEGVGFAALPAYVCKTELCSRELTRVCRAGSLANPPPPRYCRIAWGLLPAVRIFVDYLARQVKYVLS